MNSTQHSPLAMPTRHGRGVLLAFRGGGVHAAGGLCRTASERRVVAVPWRMVGVQTSRVGQPRCRSCCSHRLLLLHRTQGQHAPRGHGLQAVGKGRGQAGGWDRRGCEGATLRDTATKWNGRWVTTAQAAPHRRPRQLWGGWRRGAAAAVGAGCHLLADGLQALPLDGNRQAGGAGGRACGAHKRGRGGREAGDR